MRTPRQYSEGLLADLFRAPLDPGYAEAARRRATHGPPAGWQVTAGRGARAVTFVALGLLLVVAYQRTVAAEPQTGRARADLLADVKSREEQTAALRRQADGLRDRVGKLRDQALADTGDADRLRGLAAGAGLGKVTGNGAVVTVTDAPPQIDPVTGKQSAENPGVVLDRDLQDISNALWLAGAEAIAINGERLSATSTIRAAGGAILVDFRPVTSPYQVTAIGPGTLAEQFGASATAKRFRGFVEVYRMGFVVEARDGLTLPAAPEPRLRFAHPPSPSPSGSGGPR
jgi:uncharacterized protein YlxW (UPF0749 family)